jgi:hypothetical protein
MDLLHHPAFQSLFLPALLAWLGVLLLRRFAGVHWAPLGGAVGLLVALCVFPGFDWPATARAQKLPWTVLVGTVLAVLLVWRTAGGEGTGRQRTRGIVVAAVLTVASLGLAVTAALGGSLLLAQLAMMVATATAVPGLWSWWRPSSGLVVSATALLPLGLAWLVIAAALALAQPNGAPTDAATEDPYFTPQWK